eukprot:SAG31_NODE_38183_length_298_cov_0.783920_1_plen_25_part_10
MLSHGAPPLPSVHVVTVQLKGEPAA